MCLLGRLQDRKQMCQSTRRNIPENIKFWTLIRTAPVPICACLARYRTGNKCVSRHGVTSPKTLNVSTTVRNGTSSACSLNETLYDRLSSQCFAFFRTVRRFHLFPSPYILYTVDKRFLQNLHQQNRSSSHCRDSTLRYFHANRVLRMLFHQPLKFVLFFF